MIEAGAMLIEPATCAIGVDMQAEQLPPSSANTVW